MADQSLTRDPPDSNTLNYATPVQRLRRVRSVPALIGGIFLVLVAALTLLIGFVMIAEYDNRISSDFSITIGFAVCIFSGICLLSGIPLIYRGSQADD